MESIRYEKFTRAIDGIHKAINKIKLAEAPRLGVKGVHVFWIYKLLDYPEGLTAAEIASVIMIDKSLVSREIATLKRDGYIESRGGEGKKRDYNARLVLTEKGIEVGKRIADKIDKVLEQISDGLTEEERVAFYRSLNIISESLDLVAKTYDE